MNPLARVAAMDRKFHEDIDRLVACIETVPTEYRATLYSAADTAKEQHERLQATCRSIDDIVAGINEMVGNTILEVDAFRRALGTVDPAGRYLL